MEGIYTREQQSSSVARDLGVASGERRVSQLATEAKAGSWRRIGSESAAFDLMKEYAACAVRDRFRVSKDAERWSEVEGLRFSPPEEARLRWRSGVAGRPVFFRQRSCRFPSYAAGRAAEQFCCESWCEPCYDFPECAPRCSGAAWRSGTANQAFAEFNEGHAPAAIARGCGIHAGHDHASFASG